MERDGRLVKAASLLVARVSQIAQEVAQSFIPHVGKAVASVLIVGVVLA